MSKSKTFSAALAAVFMSVAAASLATTPANAAAVYCKTAGVPQGCIVRPTTPAPVVVAPAAPVAVKHVGYTRVTPYGVRHVGYTRVWR
jgi:N-methylhydantoinase B/oxoprolinase/acetone carboxylase alpha subunit